MRVIEWDDSFLLGFYDVDAHHRHLFALLAKTHEEFATGNPNLGPVLDELVDYARYHFKSEELWMMDGHYPGIVGHKREHACFLQIVFRMRKEFLSGNEYLSLETLQFLESWISGHILKTDAEFGRFITGITAKQD
jgi:hemerythrin